MQTKISIPSNKRVCVYVDGFNLFHSISDLKDPGQYKWLSLKALSHILLEPGASIKSIKYFSAYCEYSASKKAKHLEYVRALESEGTKVIMGKFTRTTKTYHNGKNPIISVDRGNGILSTISSLMRLGAEKILPKKLTYQTFEEKSTDVNIAINILEDGIKDNYDIAYVISADTDLLPAMQRVKELENKEFYCIFPPRKNSKVLTRFANKVHVITETELTNAQLPKVIKTKRHKIRRPISRN